MKITKDNRTFDDKLRAYLKSVQAKDANLQLVRWQADPQKVVPETCRIVSLILEDMAKKLDLEQINPAIQEAHSRIINLVTHPFRHALEEMYREKYGDPEPGFTVINELRDLMAEVMEVWKECPYCNGNGVVPSGNSAKGCPACGGRGRRRVKEEVEVADA